MNYVKLITEVYFEVNIFDQLSFELKKELFQQILKRKHSVLEKKKHISEKEFLTRCGLACNEIRSHVIETLEFRENSRYNYLNGGIDRKENIFVEIKDIGGKTNRELSEDELLELEKLFGSIAIMNYKEKNLKQLITETPKLLSTVNESFNFENKFDHVQKDRVYNYFKTELVDKNYLSLEDLHEYLIMAFQERLEPKKRFMLTGNYSIGIIRNIFYRYYSEVAQDKHGLKKQYCYLLGGYFNGFVTSKIMNNFHKK